MGNLVREMNRYSEQNNETITYQKLGNSSPEGNVYLFNDYIRKKGLYQWHKTLHEEVRIRAN
jgi:hypothetical protein